MTNTFTEENYNRTLLSIFTILLSVEWIYQPLRPFAGLRNAEISWITPPVMEKQAWI
jgi:hypothetical protein